MFFAASKIFWFFAQPLNFSILLAGLAFLAILLSRRRLALATAGLSFLILGVGAWTSVGALMMHPLEDRFQRPVTMPDRIDGIIVLGGGFEAGINLVRGGYELNGSGDRFIEAAILARRFPEAKVVVTGGAGDLILDGEADGVTAPRLLTALGVAPERLLLESKSRNTYENAMFTKAMVDAKPDQTWLLVTSAFHMPRSMGLFRKAGFNVLPWPSDYRTSGKEHLGIAQDNAQDSLQNLSMALREWIGLAVYRLTGRIDQLVPSP
ncbi:MULTISPECIES: YdcF family protein [unclassified Phyllobacterium]|uniref:YdcF family protein n=1 Tax=Phyllobacterium TaxID=28100 RepID=UPI00048005CA|nr:MULTISPECIES: YdcF family protein [unclassified Phyllobacterium]UGY08384.1 YdcF family protein [Phyllobacterium sp. T1018]